MAVYLLGNTNEASLAGKNSTFITVWQGNGYTTTASLKAAIIADSSYLASITADGYLLNNLEWSFSNQMKGNWQVVITYSHKESRRNKIQNPPLQTPYSEDSEEEETISFREIQVPILETWPGDQTGFGNSPDMGDSIEYNPTTKTVEGTTVKKFVSVLTVGRILTDAEISNTWIETREQKLFNVNNVAFRGRPAYTVQFTGFNISQRSKSGDWYVRWTFDHMPVSVRDFSGWGITGLGTETIYPFSYYWVYREQELDATAKVLVPIPKGFYKADIYDHADLNSVF